MSYCGPAPVPDDLWARWNFDPWLISIMVLTTIACLCSATSLRHRQLILSAAFVLAMVFITPICALTVALFSARVVHHVLLVAVAAPLIALAIDWQRERLAQLLMPLAFLHTVIFWLWHAPAPYELALGSTPVYWLMQLSLLGSAALIWSAIFAGSHARSIGALLLLTIQMGLLGALLVFSPEPLYAPHATTTFSFGLSPLEDQQLAGLIMWVPACVPYVCVGLFRLIRMLREQAGAPA